MGIQTRSDDSFQLRPAKNGGSHTKNKSIIAGMKVSFTEKKVLYFKVSMMIKETYYIKQEVNNLQEVL